MRRNVLLIVAVLLAGGCDLLLENPEPDTARLVISGDTGKPVRLITSTEFVAAVNDVGQTRVEIFVADTVITTLPYERVYDIKRDHRFLVEASWIDTDIEQVSVKVYLDDEKQFDESGLLMEGQPYRFVYLFNQAVTQDIVLL
jgi:hypothetical protein